MHASAVVYRVTIERACIPASSVVKTRSIRKRTRPRDIVSAAVIGLIGARLLVAVLGLDVRVGPQPIVIQATLVESATASR
jgi:hypothetical protein